jgi:regulator of protease activity HflC (stomatin/prohibitin superfamily)
MALAPFVVTSPRGHDGVGLPNVIAVTLLVASILAGLFATIRLNNPLFVVAGALLGVVLFQAPKDAQQWERGIVLRLGRFQAMEGPGLF